MAKDSTVLRYIFGFFNLLFVIIGVIIIVLTIVAHVHISKVPEFENTGVIINFYVIGVIILSISFLAAYGAFRQVGWMLVLFVVLMCVGFVYQLQGAINIATLQTQVSQIVQDDMNKFLPLDKSSYRLRKMMDKIQMSMHCCGISKGYADWNEHVPESCHCSPEEAMSHVCILLPQYSFERSFSRRAESRHFVYKQPCGPIIQKSIKTGISIGTGLFIVLTVLSIAISSCVVYQMNRERNAGVVHEPTVSSTQDKYNKLANEPYPPFKIPAFKMPKIALLSRNNHSARFISPESCHHLSSTSCHHL